MILAVVFLYLIYYDVKELQVPLWACIVAFILLGFGTTNVIKLYCFIAITACVLKYLGITIRENFIDILFLLFELLLCVYIKTVIPILLALTLFFGYRLLTNNKKIPFMFIILPTIWVHLILR